MQRAIVLAAFRLLPSAFCFLKPAITTQLRDRFSRIAAAAKLNQRRRERQPVVTVLGRRAALFITLKRALLVSLFPLDRRNQQPRLVKRATANQIIDETLPPILKLARRIDVLAPAVVSVLIRRGAQHGRGKVRNPLMHRAVDAGERALRK